MKTRIGTHWIDIEEKSGNVVLTEVGSGDGTAHSCRTRIEQADRVELALILLGASMGRKEVSR